MLNRAKASRSPTAFISSVCKSVYGLPYLFCRHPAFPRFFLSRSLSLWGSGPGISREVFGAVWFSSRQERGGATIVQIALCLNL